MVSTGRQLAASNCIFVELEYFFFRYPSSYSKMEKLHVGNAEQVSYFVHVYLSICG